MGNYARDNKEDEQTRDEVTEGGGGRARQAGGAPTGTHRTVNITYPKSHSRGLSNKTLVQTVSIGDHHWISPSYQSANLMKIMYT